MVGQEITRTKRIQSGHLMPTVGLGTGKIVDPNEVEVSVDAAIISGYRHIDTAFGYKNEAAIGKCLSKWIQGGSPNGEVVTRDELFLVTKLPLIGMHPNKVEFFLDISLKNLQTEYIDLFLIHWPVGVCFVDENELMPRDKDGELLLDLKTDLEEIWKSMEHLVKSGKARAIGLSNSNESQIKRILQSCEIPPSVLQVEVHAAFQQNELREFCTKHGILVCAHAPLGSPGRKSYINAHKLNIPQLLDNPVVQQIAAFHKKTEAQVLLKFLLQGLGVSIIPKSKNPVRIKENIEIFDFQLTSDDIIKLKELNKGNAGRSFPAFDGAKLHPECPF